MNDDLTIFCDVDDTLIMGSHVIESTLSLIKKYHEWGYKIVLWSVAGEKYARAVAKENNIEHLFYAIISKPCIYIDDRPNFLDLYSTHIYPPYMQMKGKNEVHNS